MPLFNAWLDWLSWWLSRYLLQRAANEPRWWLVLFDILLDFIAAISFMILLCILLPLGAELLDWIYAGKAETGWRDYALWARNDPWGQGLMVTLMLVTTLIPTLLHILLGLVAVLIHGFQGKQLAGYLEYAQGGADAAEGEGNNIRYALATAWISGYFFAAIGLMYALYWGFQQWLALLIAAWLYAIPNYFFDMPV